MVSTRCPLRILSTAKGPWLRCNLALPQRVILREISRRRLGIEAAELAWLAEFAELACRQAGHSPVRDEGKELMARKNIGMRVAVSTILATAALLAQGQSDSTGRSILKGAAVEYLYPEQVTVPAGKASDVQLHFRMPQGL